MLTNENFGFKRLTPDNWLETDPVSTLFETLLPEEQKQPITGQEWVRRILEPSLKDTVPLEIRRLFEVARGAMVYGYLFYPLYTLATEQLNRVVETAVSYKCETMRAPKTVNTFEKKFNWLIALLLTTSEETHN